MGMTPERGREVLSELVEDPRSPSLVEAYFSHDVFAGALFDQLGNNPPDRICIDDLFAVSLLDLRFSPVATRAVLDRIGSVDDADTSAKVHRELSRLTTAKPLWECDDDDLAPADELWAVLRPVPTLGPTRVSKLLARKRPMLLPIVDTVVQRVLPLPPEDYWRSLREVLQDASLRQALATMQPAGVEASLLRILDVLLWMHGSNARNVKRLRGGLPV